MNLEVQSKYAKSQRRPKSMKSPIYLVFLVQTISFYCGTVAISAPMLISLSEATQANAPIQVAIMIKEKKKQKIGTRITLLLSAVKSAAASITSIALANYFLPQQTQQKKAQARIPNKIIKAYEPFASFQYYSFYQAVIPSLAAI